MLPSPKPHIENIKPVFHGGAGFIKRENAEYNDLETLDFSTCCNPYGPPKIVRMALRKIDIEHYPDPESGKLIRLLSNKLGITPDSLIAGSGSTELIRLAASTYFSPGDAVVIPCPTYGEYELASTIVNARIEKFYVNEKDDFKIDCDEFISFAKSQNPAGIFLCNPNNPTGQYLGLSYMKKILKSFPDTLIILDEAYIAFTDNAWDSHSLLKRNNLLIVRSMTKDYGIAGLRMGYGMASAAIVANLKKVRPPWNVNSAAQAAGEAALSCDDYLTQCTDRIRRSKNYLTGELANMGYKVIPTSTNFFLFKAGDANHFQKRMLAKGILVRDCTSFGLPEYVRVAPLKRTHCQRFIKAVKEMRAGN
ncbi:MAG: histidinol-phosphate transaminase [Chloroflexi bacterium]|nr:histidinol-phosphate transaminase [Chloroflexota bacterium]